MITFRGQWVRCPYEDKSLLKQRTLFFWKDRSLLHSRFVQSIKVKMPSQILLWIQDFQEKFTNDWYGTNRRFHRKEVAKHRKKTQFCPNKNYWSRSRILLYRTWIPLNRAAFETWLTGHDPAISFYWLMGGRYFDESAPSSRHRRGLGSIPNPVVTCGSSSLLVPVPVRPRFYLQVLRSSSLHETNI